MTPPFSPRVSIVAAALASLTVGQPAAAQDETTSGEAVDHYELSAQSTTYVQGFQRALLPGAGGARVSTHTLVPIHEYLSLRAVDLDAPWSIDSVDIEFAAWGSGTFIKVDRRSEADTTPLVDGDISVANVRHRIGPGYVRLGRQIVTAGVSRFSQLDGVSAGARADFGLGVDAYAGLTVLPRWAERPGYQHLGSARELLRDPDALPDPERSGNWRLGSRVYYQHTTLGSIGTSFHEQFEDGELGRRDVGADLSLTPVRFAALHADGFLDTDSGQLAQAQARLEVEPHRNVDTVVEYRHVQPALLLSRQSVLSVFAVDDFDEVGGEVGVRPSALLRVSTSAHVQDFGADQLGTRLQVRLRMVPVPRDRLIMQLALSRLSEAENGYYGGRASLAYRFAEPATLTLEHYVYLYDTPIRGVAESTVDAANVEWWALDNLSLLLGTSLVRSPYAALDAQTLLRVRYGFDISAGGPR